MAAASAPTPWALAHRDEARARAITAPLPQTSEAAAAWREERWHAARLIRRRYQRPASWLDLLDLTDVPEEPDGCCTCPAGGAGG